VHLTFIGIFCHDLLSSGRGFDYYYFVLRAGRKGRLDKGAMRPPPVFRVIFL
jgi:hypothetical protein